jgi:hypothetical protein
VLLFRPRAVTFRFCGEPGDGLLRLRSHVKFGFRDPRFPDDIVGHIGLGAVRLHRESWFDKLRPVFRGRFVSTGGTSALEGRFSIALARRLALAFVMVVAVAGASLLMADPASFGMDSRTGSLIGLGLVALASLVLVVELYLVAHDVRYISEAIRFALGPDSPEPDGVARTATGEFVRSHG